MMLERYRPSLDIKSGTLINIPRNGPIVLITNHPYGMIDELIISYNLAHQRGNSCVLAHYVFSKANELKNIIMPISFDEDKKAITNYLQSRKWALEYLQAGGAIGVFPGGTVYRTYCRA